MGKTWKNSSLIRSTLRLTISNAEGNSTPASEDATALKYCTGPRNANSVYFAGELGAPVVNAKAKNSPAPSPVEVLQSSKTKAISTPTGQRISIINRIKVYLNRYSMIVVYVQFVSILLSFRRRSISSISLLVNVYLLLPALLDVTSLSICSPYTASTSW